MRRQARVFRTYSCFLMFFLIIGLPCVATLEGAQSPPAPGYISGTIEYEPGDPVQNPSCMVILEGTPMGGRCFPHGVFEIKSVPPGNWVIRVEIDGKKTRRFVSVVSGQGTNISIYVKSLFPRTVVGNIVGKVEYAPGEPVTDCVVVEAKNQPQFQGRCNSSGNFEITTVRAGIYDVNIIVAGVSQLHKIGVVDGTTYHLHAIFPKPKPIVRTAGSVAGRVSVWQGNPTDILRTCAVVIPKLGLTTLPDVNGRFEFSSVPTGTHALEVIDLAGQSDKIKQSINVDSGQVTLVPISIGMPLRPLSR
jgi:hypothetical protein